MLGIKTATSPHSVIFPQRRGRKAEKREDEKKEAERGKRKEDGWGREKVRWKRGKSKERGREREGEKVEK